MSRMKVSAYWIIYKQHANIKRSCDTLIQCNDNKTTNAFEHSCDLCHKYALYLCFIYIYIYETQNHRINVVEFSNKLIKKNQC